MTTDPRTIRGTCPTRGGIVVVEWREYPYHDEWAYFTTMHSRPDGGWAICPSAPVFRVEGVR